MFRLEYKNNSLMCQFNFNNAKKKLDRNTKRATKVKNVAPEDGYEMARRNHYAHGRRFALPGSGINDVGRLYGGDRIFIKKTEGKH